MSHDLCLPLADGEAKLPASTGKAVDKLCKSSAVCVATAASSAKRKSLRHLTLTLVFAFNLAMLKSFPSDHALIYFPSVRDPNAFFSRTNKYIPNSVGAKTQPCLTPLLISKVSEMLPS